MTTMSRRIGRLERIEEQTRRAPIRAHIYRIMERLGGTLPAADVEALVTRYAGAPERIQRWHSKGLSPEQIEARLLGEA
jgi:hypothetical protein